MDRVPLCSATFDDNTRSLAASRPSSARRVLINFRTHASLRGRVVYERAVLFVLATPSTSTLRSLGRSTLDARRYGHRSFVSRRLRTSVHARASLHRRESCATVEEDSRGTFRKGPFLTTTFGSDRNDRDTRTHTRVYLRRVAWRRLVARASQCTKWIERRGIRGFAREEREEREGKGRQGRSRNVLPVARAP